MRQTDHAGRPVLLFVEPFTVGSVDRRPAGLSSLGMGYGFTSSLAIKDGLSESGFRVVTVPRSVEDCRPASRTRRLHHHLETYQQFSAAVARCKPDLVLLFHTMAAFPVELRRILMEHNCSAPIIGYTHGSHWDPTDSTRNDLYPALRHADLANLLTLDRVLVVSEYFKAVLIEQIRRFSPEAGERLERTARVVGLPLSTDVIDACRAPGRFERTTMVFNHAPTRAKNPDGFMSVLDEVLDAHDCDAVFTRSLRGSPFESRFSELRRRYGRRVRAAGNLSIAEYYRLLWKTHIQVSTAEHETLGMATLEAMYTSNACFLPRRASYPEIVDGCSEALYGTLDELAARIARATKDEEWRRALGEHLTQRSLAYSPSTVVGKIVAVIEEFGR